MRRDGSGNGPNGRVRGTAQRDLSIDCVVGDARTA